MDSLTPLFEKVMLPIGVAVAALNISGVGEWVGVLVGLVTICMVVPRAIMNWHEVYVAWRAKREEKKRLKAMKKVLDKYRLMTIEEHKAREPEAGDVVRLSFYNGDPWLYYECPGCLCAHSIPVNGAKNEGGHGWQWDGSYTAPTISPSINATYPGYCCHHFVKAGIMDVLADSTTNGGKKLPLAPI